MPPIASREQPGFRAFYDGLPIAVALLDEQFRFSDVNSAFELAFDFSSAELVGRPLMLFFDDTTRERLPLIQSRMRNDETRQQVIECQVDTRLGRTYEANVHLSVFQDGGRRFYLAMVQSLGEIRERERLLLSQAEMFRVTIEQSPLPMSIQDNSFRFVMVNKAYTELTGYSEHQLIGRDAADFLHPEEDRSAVRRQRELVHAQGMSDLPRFSMRREIVRRDGRRIPYRMELGRSRGLDGQPLWVAVLIDLSRQEQAEARQAALLESVGAGVAHVVDGLIQQINPALAQLTGRAAHELVDQPASTLFADPTAWPRLEAEVRLASAPTALVKRYLDLRSSAHSGKCRCEIALRVVDTDRPDHGLLLTANDVGELLDRSDRLEHSLSELETLIDTEPVGIAHLVHGRIVHANRALRHLLLGSDADLVGARFARFCPSAAPAMFERAADDSPTQDTVTRAELYPLDGPPIPSLLHISPVSRNSDETVIVAIDLSQQKAALDHASRMQMRFDSFSAMVDQAVLIVDTTADQIRHANAATAHVLGLASPGLLGQHSASLWTHLRADDRPRAERQLRRAFEGLAGELTVERMHHDTTLTLKLHFYASPQPTEVFVLGEDITSQVREERRRLSEAVAQRETLVREVQHRIKNNLQGVAGLLEQTAIDQPALHEPVRKLAGKIQTIAQVHGLQIRPGESVAADRLVQSVVASLQRTMDLPIRYESLSDPSTSAASALGISESAAISIALVVNELVTNACKHRRGDEPVAVHLVTDDKQAIVRIINQGELAPGFDPLQSPSPARGMGLIDALLPRPGSALRLLNIDAHVVAELRLQEPLLMRLVPAD
ncbi:MAG: PAS domain S-box protein [Burkholderiaceae bacterium]